MEGKAPAEEQEKVQQVVGELREAQQNIEKLQRQSEVLSNSIEEIKTTMETVEGLEDVEPGTEILVPIGSESYITAEIKNTEKILSNLGADLVAERSHKEVTKLLEKQKKDFEESLERIQNGIEELEEKIEDLREKGQKFMGSPQQR